MEKQALILAIFLMLNYSLSICLCLNNEGMALLKFKERVERDPLGALSSWKSDDVADDHCSWFGIECLDGKVIVLSLKDLFLEGTLAPEIGRLTYMKSITLRNNSFRGNIPNEIVELGELEVLDLGYNNFSGPIPPDLVNNLSLSIFLVDNNKLLNGLSPKHYEFTSRSKSCLHENQLVNVAFETSSNSKSGAWDTIQEGIAAERKLLQVPNSPNTLNHINNGQNKEAGGFPPTTAAPFSSQVSPSPSPSPSPSFSFPPSISVAPVSPLNTPPVSLAPSPSPISPLSQAPSAPAPGKPTLKLKPFPGTPIEIVRHSSKSKHGAVILWASLASGFVLLILCLLGILICRSSKMVAIKPWSSELSGQLQKAFVSGLPKLQRSELVTACEDFSNVIGSISDGTVYKGTLSSGVEIAVTTIADKAAEFWSKSSEAQFIKKIEVLSSVNHKNFMNLIGYCEEETPFTRMMVFEYAPNGTLFEHLYIKESEHLDWGTRIRIATGMAYCLDHMHDLTPPLALSNLRSSSVFLTEDYASKISDFTFWNEMTATKMGSPTTELLETFGVNTQSNVYSYGVILFELITGKLPYSVNNDLGDDWAADYLKQLPALKDIVDPTLRFVPDEELDKLTEVIKICVNPDPKRRLTMKEITAKLKDITAMGPNGATPMLSPLWWAELEILSSEAS